MKRRTVTSVTSLSTLVACAVTMLFATTGAQASAGMSVTAAGGARFPDRTLVLTLPSRVGLAPGDVHVSEAGAPVSHLSITPLRASAAQQYGVVLVIDTSDSMRGTPVRAALDAAGALVSQLSAQTPVALVEFNRTAAVVQPFTNDHATITAALAGEPSTDSGTHIYDAVQAAVRLAQRARLSAGSVVVLSDGADTGSRTSQAAVIQAARTAHVRLFTVGLRSPDFRPTTLAGLAEDGDGRYTEASSTAQLAPISKALGSVIANQYLVSYRSLAGPGVELTVTVTVAGIPGAATIRYTTPRLPTHGGVFSQPVAERFWASQLAIAIVAAFVAVISGLAAVLLLRRPGTGVRERMARFVSVGTATGADPRRPLGDRLYSGTERSFSKTGWWGRLKDTLEVAEISVPAAQIVVWTTLATLLCMWLLAIVTGIIWTGALGLLIVLIPKLLIDRKVLAKRRTFADQLPDNLQVLASALRAGHSFVGALSVVVGDSPEPSASEFQRVIADEQLGVPLEEAIEVVARRMDNRDLAQVGLVAALQRETGGNTAEVLDRVTETIRSRAELRRLVHTLTAQGRMSRWVVSALPLFLFAAIFVLNPGYLDPLLHQTIGRVLLAVAMLMIIAGSLVIRRIINIKV